MLALGSYPGLAEMVHCHLLGSCAFGAALGPTSGEAVLAVMLADGAMLAAVSGVLTLAMASLLVRAGGTVLALPFSKALKNRCIRLTQFTFSANYVRIFQLTLHK